MKLHLNVTTVNTSTMEETGNSADKEDKPDGTKNLGQTYEYEETIFVNHHPAGSDTDSSLVLKPETINGNSIMQIDDKYTDVSNNTEDYLHFERKDDSVTETSKKESADSSVQVDREINDTGDGLLKYFRMCSVGKTKLLDEDDETYGFTDKTESKPKKRKRPTLYRSDNAYLHPTPLSVHCKEIASETFKFLSSPLHNHQKPSHTKSVQNSPVETSPQQETGLPSEIVTEDQYNFSYPQRGHMVLIVNDRFLRQSTREGAIWDLQNTKQIAAKLGFRIFNSKRCRNLTKKETIAILREAQNLDHSDSDCFMFVISTHGLEMPNPRAKGALDHVIVCADDQLIFTSNILDMFSERNCPTLKNKPKMFFIQACRGEEFDRGSEIKVIHSVGSEDKIDKLIAGKDALSSDRRKQRSFDEVDVKPSGDSWAQRPTSRTTVNAQVSQSFRSHTSDTNMPFMDENQSEQESSQYLESHTARMWSFGGQQPAENQNSSASQRFEGEDLEQRPYPINDTPSLKCDNDFLVMYAIPPGYFAWRNTLDGSWMLHYLHKTIMSYNMKKPQDFLTLLRKVSRRMSQRQTNTPSDKRMHAMKAIPVIEHKLDKDIVFKPKAVMSGWIRHDTTFLA